MFLSDSINIATEIESQVSHVQKVNLTTKNVFHFKNNFAMFYNTVHSNLKEIDRVRQGQGMGGEDAFLSDFFNILMMNPISYRLSLLLHPKAPG